MNQFVTFEGHIYFLPFEDEDILLDNKKIEE